MSSEYTIQCPIKGTYHSILSKKGQKIVKNYKYMKYDHLKGGIDTTNEKFLTIRKEFIQLNTTSAILQFTENIKEPRLLNMYLIVLSSTSSDVLINGIIELLINNFSSQSIHKLKTLFTTYKENIINGFNVDDITKYILIRLLTFEHFILSIIEECKPYTPDVSLNILYKHYVEQYTHQKYRFLSE